MLTTFSLCLYIHGHLVTCSHNFETRQDCTTARDKFTFEKSWEEKLDIIGGIYKKILPEYQFSCQNSHTRKDYIGLEGGWDDPTTITVPIAKSMPYKYRKKLLYCLYHNTKTKQNKEKCRELYK